LLGKSQAAVQVARCNLLIGIYSEKIFFQRSIILTREKASAKGSPALAPHALA
jgi:hypothetical protein